MKRKSAAIDALPHDDVAEQGLLACVLLDASVYPKILEAGCSVRWFTDLQRSNLFSQIGRLWDSGMRDALSIVMAIARENPEFGRYINGLREYCDKLTPSAANWPAFVDPLRNAYAKRTIYLATQSARELIANPTVDASEVAADLANALSFAQPKSKLPGLLDGSRLVSEAIERPHEMVHGLVHQGSKLIFGGSSKAGKTWTMLDLCVSVATGSDFWGMRTTKGTVAYLNLELPTWACQERLEWVCRSKGVALEPGQLLVWPLRGRACRWTELENNITTTLQNANVSLAVIDPLYKLYGDQTDENSAGDMASLCNGFERLAVSTGATVCYAAHYSKGNQAAKSSLDRVSGSGALSRDADTIVAMTSHEEENCFSIEPTLRCMAPMPPFVVKWNCPLFERVNLDPARLKQATGRAAKYSLDDILGVLGGRQMSYSEWKDACVSEHEMSERTFDKLLKEAKGRELVLLMKTTDKYVVLCKTAQ